MEQPILTRLTSEHADNGLGTLLGPFHCAPYPKEWIHVRCIVCCRQVRIGRKALPHAFGHCWPIASANLPGLAAYQACRHSGLRSFGTMDVPSGWNRWDVSSAA